MMKKLILILLLVSIIGFTPLYCSAEEEGSDPLGIGTEELM
ncbi:hypothetical protein [Lutispora sp.]|nr:hypothetical protein [Lutispora sp.]MEA4960156.1 hypothetical protein [Lutispora sp.]